MQLDLPKNQQIFHFGSLYSIMQTDESIVMRLKKNEYRASIGQQYVGYNCLCTCIVSKERPKMATCVKRCLLLHAIKFANDQDPRIRQQILAQSGLTVFAVGLHVSFHSL